MYQARGEFEKEYASTAYMILANVGVSVIVLLCILVPNTAAQFTKYVLPSDPGYVPCFVPGQNGTVQKSYCPPNTECVESVVADGLWRLGLSDGDLTHSQVTAPGCCPPEASVPCFGLKSRYAVPGCCPENTTCCMDIHNGDKHVACVSDPRQCCGGIVCAEGYSCCQMAQGGGAYCCPGENFCAGSAVITIFFNETLNSTYSNEYTVNSSYMPNTYPEFALTTLSTSRIYSDCQNLTNGTLVPWEEPNQAYRCGPSWCKGPDLTLGEADVCVDITGAPMNTTNSTVLEELGAFCCPPNATACPRNPPNFSQYIVGCANEAIGESCCANQICAVGSRCCNIPSPPWWETSPNSTFAGGNLSIDNPGTNMCCPNGTFCCAMLMPQLGAPDFSPSIFSYCGRNSNCTSIATVSEFVQPVPAVNSFYPDYIEQYGWFHKTLLLANPPVDAPYNLATAFPPGSILCGTCLQACTCFDTNHIKCADQCQLSQPDPTKLDDEANKCLVSVSDADFDFNNPDSGELSELLNSINCGCGSRYVNTNPATPPAINTFCHSSNEGDDVLYPCGLPEDQILTPLAFP